MLMRSRSISHYPNQNQRCHRHCCRIVCWTYVGDWMRSSRLKLNPDKTEVSLFGINYIKKNYETFPAKLLDQEITPTDSVRNLGVVFDGGLNFRKYISLVCLSCYYHIRDLCRLRRCLTSKVSKTIATALVSSKLDYCNGIFYNVTNRELNRLQGVQNCLARVVTRSPHFSRTSPLLKSLHWLPACFKIKSISQSILRKCLHLRSVLVIFTHLTKMCYLFLGLRPRRVKALLLWRHQNCGIISPVKLEIKKQFTLSEKK